MEAILKFNLPAEEVELDVATSAGRLQHCLSEIKQLEGCQTIDDVSKYIDRLIDSHGVARFFE